MAYLRTKGAAFCQAIEVFSCDMWDSYINSAKAILPHAKIVIDRFHVMQNLHDVIDNTRRALRRKHPQDLRSDEKVRLEQAFSCFPDLEQIWQLKEDFCKWYDLFDCPDKADWWLTHWVDQAKALENPYMDRFLKTLNRRRSYILNFFIHRITNGLVEGIKNIIKAIKRRAFGFTRFDHFRLRVLLECR